MSILDRYLLRQALRPMGATVLIALLALLAERALSVVELVIGWRGSLLIVFEMLSYLIPHYMGLALPAAFFIGILFAYSRLSRDSELDAMSAGGYGLVQMVLPMVWLAIVIMALHVALVSHLQPYSRYAYRAAVHAVTNASFLSLVQADRFVTIAGTTYRVERIRRDGSLFEGIFLHTEDPERGDVVLTSKSGEVLERGALDPIELRLHDGVQQLIRSDGDGNGDGNRGPASLTLRFREFVTDLSGREPEPFRRRGSNERELTLPELFAYPHTDVPIRFAGVHAELHARLVRSLSILVLPFLALPLSLGRRRAQRSYGFIIGITVLIGYNQLIKTTEGIVDDGKMSAWIGLWLPFAIFTAGSLIAFFRTAWKVPEPNRGRRFDRVVEAIQHVFRGQGKAEAGS